MNMSRGQDLSKEDAEVRRENQPVVLPVRQPVPVDQPAVPPPEYEFLQVNGDFKPADVASRRLIRSHVMRNYFQEKRNQANGLSSANSASTVNARDKLKGRWRLGTTTQSEEGEQPKQRRRSKDVATASSKSSQKSCLDKALHDPGQLITPSSASSASSIEGSHPLSQDDARLLRSTPVEQFECYQIDPFDTLPIPGGARSNRIVHFYQNHFTINSLAVNPTRTLYNHVMRDPGLYHGMLTTVSLYMHGHCGIEAKADILYHRGETMKIIHSRLNNMQGVDVGMLMAVIVTILSFENLCGNYFTSRAHLTALRRLITSAGGVEQFATTNDSLPRAIAWGEYHYAAAHRAVPPYKYKPALVTEEIPEDLQLEAARNCPYNLVTMPTYGHTIYNIFRRIHMLGIVTSMSWKSRREGSLALRLHTSNMLLDAEYDMLVISARFGRSSRSDDDSEELIAVSDALVTSAQIYLFVVLRSMPIGARIVEIYLSRLKLALERGRLIESWENYASLEALLWVLFITGCAATGRPERDYILSELRCVVATLGIKDKDTLERNLIGFAWSDFFAPYLEQTCSELFRSQTEPLVQRDPIEELV